MNSLMKRMLCIPGIKVHNGRMIRNLDISLLRTFVTVADHGGMTAAGHCLHLTQSAVSQQISRLEALCGPLFIRGGRKLRLTATGERLLEKSRQMTALNDELWREMNTGPVTETLRLGLPADLINTGMPQIIRQFCRSNPQTDIQLFCLPSPELREATETGRLDLALTEEPAGKNHGELLRTDKLIWAGAKDGSAYLKRPLPVSMVAENCAFRPLVTASLAASGLPWRTLFESGSPEVTLATVSADLAITVCLHSLLPAELISLSHLPQLPDLPAFSINLRMKRGQPSPSVTALARVIRQAFIPPLQ